MRPPAARARPSAGDRVRVRGLATAGALNATVEVLAPDGTTVCGAGTAGYVCRLEDDGPHTVLVRDWTGTRSGGYRLALQRLGDPVGCRTIEYGTASSPGSLTEAGEADCWRFNGFHDDWRGGPGDRVRVRLIATSGAADPVAEVLRPSGTTRCQPTLSDSFDCEVDDDGLQTIVVRDLAGTATGTYRIAIQRVNDPVGCATVSASFVGSGDTGCRRFHGEFNEPMRIRTVNGAGAWSPVTEVLGPDGTTECPPTFAHTFTCKLDTTGIHTILVRDAGILSGPYAVTSHHLASTLPCHNLFRYPPADGEHAIDTWAEIECFEFRNDGIDYVGGDTLIARVEATSGSLDPVVEVLRPDGSTLCGPRSADGLWFSCRVGYGTQVSKLLVYDAAGTETGHFEIDIS
jgi:hypothetical protein